VALVERGLVDSRSAAQRAIAAGRVTVGGMPASKASTLVDGSAAVAITDGAREWASRAGHKLDGALDVFEVEVAGGRALDVGASTGGFTDVLLSRGAASVTALDVGYGQLVWRLRTDERVTVVDRMNVREADPVALGAPFDLVTVDVSFISVGLIAPQLAAMGSPGTEYVILVKPQFEAGRDRVGPGGVVEDDAVRADAVLSAAGALRTEGIPVLDATGSPLPGATGNREVFLHGRLASEHGIDDHEVVERMS
jgi:23S rRNA (cytidine1920-2'-O)/16S rRNA (cytidine1409-2'-O)-methyltransferase